MEVSHPISILSDLILFVVTSVFVYKHSVRSDTDKFVIRYWLILTCVALFMFSSDENDDSDNKVRRVKSAAILAVFLAMVPITRYMFQN